MAVITPSIKRFKVLLTVKVTLINSQTNILSDLKINKLTF